ncbi:MAG: DUF4166 domain-containing protein [Pseudomonadota bacterium]
MDNSLSKPSLFERRELKTRAGSKVRNSHKSLNAAGYPDFQKLMGEAAWQRLPAAVRRRFDREAVHFKERVYTGEMLVVYASKLGKLLATFCRLIGSPVVPRTGNNVSMFVRLFNVPQRAGIAWERIYRFDDHPVITVRSTKMLHDENTLVETLGFGLRMPLRLFEHKGDLIFASTGYFFQWGWIKIPLPYWFPPGKTVVTHRDLGYGKFQFILQTDHPWFGQMFYQEGVFEDGESE